MTRNNTPWEEDSIKVNDADGNLAFEVIDLVKPDKLVPTFVKGAEYSDWRKELEESWSNVTTGNKVGQTFLHVPSGTTVSTGGAIGGVESIQSTINIAGEAVPAPDITSYTIQGYAVPFPGLIRKTKKEPVNARLDASEKVAKKAKADVSMKARVESDSESTKTSRTIKAAETFIRYLFNKLPEGKWNDYMGKDYVDYAIKNGTLMLNGGVSVGDNIIGSAGSMTFDSRTGKYRINFKGLGVDDNITQFSKGDYNIWQKAALNALGKYSADLQPSGLPWWLGSVQAAIGAGASKVYEFSKLFGGGKDVDAFIEFSPDELFSKNSQLAQDYVQQKFGLTGPVWSPRMMGSPQGSDPSVTHSYYALYGKLPPTSVVKGSIPYNSGDHPEYDPKEIARINRIRKEQAAPLKPSNKPKTKTKRQSLSLDKPIVRRKSKTKKSNWRSELNGN